MSTNAASVRTIQRGVHEKQKECEKSITTITSSLMSILKHSTNDSFRNSCYKALKVSDTSQFDVTVRDSLWTIASERFDVTSPVADKSNAEKDDSVCTDSPKVKAEECDETSQSSCQLTSSIQSDETLSQQLDCFDIITSQRTSFKLEAESTPLDRQCSNHLSEAYIKEETTDRSARLDFAKSPQSEKLLSPHSDCFDILTSNGTLLHSPVVSEQSDQQFIKCEGKELQLDELEKRGLCGLLMQPTEIPLAVSQEVSQGLLATGEEKEVPVMELCYPAWKKRKQEESKSINPDYVDASKFKVNGIGDSHLDVQASSTYSSNKQVERHEMEDWFNDILSD